MIFRVLYSYEIGDESHSGEYITDNPAEFNKRMLKWYGDTFRCKIIGAGQ